MICDLIHPSNHKGRLSGDGSLLYPEMGSSSLNSGADNNISVGALEVPLCVCQNFLFSHS